MNSTVPAFTYPASRASAQATLPISVLWGSIDGRGGGLLDDFLISPLDGALTLAQMDDVPVRIGQDLDLDVPGAWDVALQKDAIIPEALSRLLPGFLESGGEFLGPVHDAQAPASAARGRLDENRVPELFGDSLQALRVVCRHLVTGDHGNPGTNGQLFGGDLVAQRGNGLRGGADEDESGIGNLFERNGRSPKGTRSRGERPRMSVQALRRRSFRRRDRNPGPGPLR